MPAVRARTAASPSRPGSTSSRVVSAAPCITRTAGTTTPAARSWAARPLPAVPPPPPPPAPAAPVTASGRSGGGVLIAAILALALAIGGVAVALVVTNKDEPVATASETGSAAQGGDDLPPLPEEDTATPE